MTVVIGDSESGKSTAIRLALSSFGCQRIGLHVKGSNALFTYGKKFHLPFGYAKQESKGKQVS